MTHLTVAFHNFANAPNNNNYTVNVQNVQQAGVGDGGGWGGGGVSADGLTYWYLHFTGKA